MERRTFASRVVPQIAQRSGVGRAWCDGVNADADAMASKVNEPVKPMTPGLVAEQTDWPMPPRVSGAWAALIRQPKSRTSEPRSHRRRLEPMDCPGGVTAA